MKEFSKPAKNDANPLPPDELVQADDAIIGRALRWSGLALGLIALMGVAWWAYYNRAPEKGPVQVTTLTAPTLPNRPETEMPVVTFTDITTEAGLEFIHVNGASGDKLLPESMGGGVAFFDYDADNDQDLLFINSQPWPWDQPSPASPAPTLALYRNDGRGKFDDVTKASGLNVSLYGMGVAIGDYDNNGFSDVFITAVGGNRLFQNQGNGLFLNVSAPAGVIGKTNEWSTSAAWADVDNDGDLDLFVCNYVHWSKEIDLEVGYKIDGSNRAYGQPMNFEGTNPYLYLNEGNGHFTDISQRSGIQISHPDTGRPMAKSLGVAPVDLDQDGWIDLVVANDTVQNFVFHNQQDGTFKEIGALTGLAFDNNGQTRGAMGIDTARYRNNDTLGIAIGNFANEMTALYVSQNTPLLFSDEAIPEGIGPASRLLLKFGLFFFDYDLDGRLDLLTANGHLEEEIAKLQKSQTYAQPAQLFWNAGPGQPEGFVSVPASKAGPDLFKPIVGRGSAFADIDGDGDLDVVLTQTGGRPLLLRNDQHLNHHWVRLKLVGGRGNRDAIGAEIKLGLNNSILSRLVMPTRSYLSQSELPVTIGLGTSTNISSLEILWPGGQTQSLPPATLVLDSLTVLEQPTNH